MKASQKAIDLIKEFEGFRSKSYLCPAGKWTIGYGHTKGVKPNDVVDEKTAEKYLIEDIEWAEDTINKYVLNLNQNQFDALVSFVYNAGYSDTLFRMINSKFDADKIAAWWRTHYIISNGKVQKGLIRRRKAEAYLFETGELNFFDK